MNDNVSERGQLLPVRFRWNEWLGALGDLGTLAPILLSLSVLNGVDLARSLVFAGLLYAAAAAYFRVPMPVQPLKAMAAIALASGFEPSVIGAASILIGVALLALSLTGGAEKLARLFPAPVVKGIQFGVGLMMLKASWKLLAQAASSPHAPQLFAVTSLTAQDFWIAFWFMVIPQIPLTLGNSVFACADAAEGYFGGAARRVRPKALTLSLGAANVLAGFFGGYPLCHGSGGLTAHVRFGARTAGAGLIMGAACLSAAFFLGPRSYDFLSSIPTWLLGVTLIYVGVSHGALVRSLREKRNVARAVVAGFLGAALNNLMVTLVAAWVWGLLEGWGRRRFTAGRLLV